MLVISLRTVVEMKFLELLKELAAVDAHEEGVPMAELKVAVQAGFAKVLLRFETEFALVLLSKMECSVVVQAAPQFLVLLGAFGVGWAQIVSLVLHYSFCRYLAFSALSSGLLGLAAGRRYS